jgi:HK97 gp10 family phage protein
MSDLVHVKGLAELEKFMDQLTPKIEANVARGALRAGMNIVKLIAQSNIHSVSGELAKGLKIGTRRRGSLVTANLKATGPHGFIAKFLEFGTKAHFITAKTGWLSFGGIFAKSVFHPGIPKGPKAFMRPALDSQAQAAVIATAEYIKNRLATKEGIDTSHVKIEGDE